MDNYAEPALSTEPPCSSLGWVRRRPLAVALLLVSFLSLLSVAVGSVLFARHQTERARQEDARRQQAEQDFERARAIAQRGTRAHDESRTAQNKDEQLEKVRQAEADYEQATTLLTRLLTDYPNVVSHRDLLANVQHQHGLLLRDLNRHLESTKVLRTSLPLWRRLVEDVPDQPIYRRKLGQTCNDLAIALASTKRLGEVEALWHEAIALQEKLVAEQPDNAAFWQDLVNSSGSLVFALKQEKGCRQLVDIQERRGQAFPGVRDYEMDLGQAYYRLAEVLVQLKRLDDAMEVLRKAATRGLGDVNALRKQPAWQPLRERADFQKLLE